jgi:hypothetical protein
LTIIISFHQFFTIFDQSQPFWPKSTFFEQCRPF